MKGIHVFLDDLRACPLGFVWARNVEECILLLQECEVSVLSLDYDLGWGQPTGLEVARYIVASQRYPQELYLHTSSITGRWSMYQLLYPNKPDAAQLFNGPIPDEKLQYIAKMDKNRL
ncbi:cyclic-phosphate processing receiver domain-containing protein [Paenibacillus rigui]|uniref:Cell division protein FtsJ n=1 Tax=Paenibacillus rigui TaxID=554312 RepID=A0A229UWY5_9BACL|nr:cyclic-phosphate processing receiver domain-containing protein [Paenibacillus rigui]OXM87900.1 cell division protein FtsJ [Paenibacillus rigui]